MTAGRWPARKADWVGLGVVTTREMRNGWGVIPTGTAMTIEDVSPGRLTLIADPCACCGMRATIWVRAKVGDKVSDVRLADGGTDS